MDDTNFDRQHLKLPDSAFKMGRPLNKVMIVITGQSGDGKSSLIKSCFSEVENSDNEAVVEYGKEICVDVKSPPIKSTLSFVELPNNLELMVRFRKEHSDLACHELSGYKPSEAREQVYPNLVVFTLSATDNRMVGPDSNLQKSFKVLKQTALVDTQLTNLVIVVTHAMSLPLKAYTTNKAKISLKISKAVFEIFRIKDVKIVFVENFPEDYEMQKPTAQNFYQLPDGEMSHHNFIESIIEQMDTNKDLLGSLISKWYFTNQRFTERDHKAPILYRVQCCKDDTVRSTDVRSKNRTTGVQESDVNQEFNFQYIGRGYCPRAENLKNVTVFAAKEAKLVDMLGAKYVIPSSVDVKSCENEQSYLLTGQTKDQYEKQKQLSYGLSSEQHDLSVIVDQSGKWVRDGSSRRTNASILFVYEKRLVEVTLPQPKSHMKKELVDEMNHLPDVYEKANCHIFNEFFSKWGSHFIVEEWLGGSIEVESVVPITSYSEKMGTKITKDLQSYFAGDGPVFIDPQETVTTFGGEPSHHFFALQDITPIRIVEWVQGLSSYPTELKHCIKLCPYFSLAERNQSISLKQATMEYLSGAMLSKLKQRKRGFGRSQNEPDNIGEGECLIPRKIRSKCLPLSAKIYTRKGLEDSSNLTPGCDVLTVSHASAGNKTYAKFTEFLTYLHYDPDTEAEFLVLELENGKILTVSRNHLVFSVFDETIKAVLAKNIKPGDTVLFVDEDKKVKTVMVSTISTTEIVGVYAPLTIDGTIIVDGVLVSCYANIESFGLAHFSLMPLRMWHRAKKALRCLPYFRSAPHQFNPRTGIHIYARLLLFLRKLIWFKT